MAENSAYAVLGIPKGMSDKEIKTAYVNLVKKYDPEKHTERFMVIQQAYERLRQSKSRAKEDVLSLNMASGEYLFNDDERWNDPSPPDEAFIGGLRNEFLHNAADEKAKARYCTTLFARAHYLVTRKQLSDAIRDWTEVLEHVPSNARARHNLELAASNLGISYALHGLYAEAIELMEKALKINPDNTDIVQNLAILAERARDPQRTHKYWKEIMSRWKAQLDRESDNDYLRHLITEALSHQEQISELMHEGRNSQSPSQSKPIAAPASSAAPSAVSSPAGDAPQPPVRATNSRTTIPKLSSKDLEVYTPDEARIDRFREIARLNPDDFEAQMKYCGKLMEEKQYDQAEEELKKLALTHKKNTEVLNLLGLAQLYNNKKDDAFMSWKRSLGMDPKNPATREHLVRAHLNLGKAFRNKGIFTQALVHFKQLIQLMPRSAEVRLEIAATYDMKGDVRSALSEYNEVLKIDPKHAVAKKAINDLRMKR